MKQLLLVVPFVIGSSLGFAPALPLGRLAALATTSTTTVHSSSTSTNTAATDAFTTYSISNPLQQLAYQDTVIGDGETIEAGKVVTVAYEGRLMSNGYKFDFGTGYAFRFGDGNVIPGWEVGLVVCTVLCCANGVA